MKDICLLFAIGLFIYGLYNMIKRSWGPEAYIPFIFAGVAFLYSVIPTRGTIQPDSPATPSTTTEVPSAGTEPSDKPSNTGSNDKSTPMPITKPVISEAISTTPVPDEIINITGNSFSGAITEDKQEIQYTYEPPVSGTYRFDFDIDNVENSYKFAIDAANGERLASSSSTNGGKTVELSQREKYNIVVQQYSGKPQYTVKIGIPNAVRTITDSRISGTLNYQDQTDNYLYTAPLTGQYRFDFTSSDVTCDYKVLVRGSNQEELTSTRYSNRGKTLNLSEGETYSIVVKQYSGYLDYDITIGLPNAIQTIEGNSFSGSITYADQLDRYLYTAPITGRYRFDFASDDVQNDYRFYMYKSDNTNLASTRYTNHGKTVDLEAGETYRIEVKQSSGMENYTINIGVPNGIANVEGNSIWGTLTYTDQEALYLYTPPATGKYLFSFGTNDAATDYKFYITSAQNEEITASRCNNSSRSAELVGGQTYTIKVKQYSGFPAYQIDIILQQ